MKRREGIPYDGFGNVLEMLKRSDASFREKILRNLRQMDPELARRLEIGLRTTAREDSRAVLERGQRIAELKSINKMFRHIEHFLDLDKLLQEIVDEAISVTNADGGLERTDEVTDNILRCVVQQGHQPGFAGEAGGTQLGRQPLRPRHQLGPPRRSEGAVAMGLMPVCLVPVRVLPAASVLVHAQTSRAVLPQPGSG